MGRKLETVRTQGTTPDKQSSPKAMQVALHPSSSCNQPMNNGPIIAALANAVFMRESELANMSIFRALDASSATNERSAPRGERKKIIVDPIFVSLK